MICYLTRKKTFICARVKKKCSADMSVHTCTGWHVSRLLLRAVRSKNIVIHVESNYVPKSAIKKHAAHFFLVAGHTPTIWCFFLCLRQNWMIEVEQKRFFGCICLTWIQKEKRNDTMKGYNTLNTLLICSNAHQLRKTLKNAPRS